MKTTQRTRRIENEIEPLRPQRTLRFLFRRRGQGHAAADALPFHHGVNRVWRNVAQCLHPATGPADFYGINLGLLTQSEVLTQVVLRKIAATALDLTELHQL